MTGFQGACLAVIGACVVILMAIALAELRSIAKTMDSIEPRLVRFLDETWADAQARKASRERVVYLGDEEKDPSTGLQVRKVVKTVDTYTGSAGLGA